MLWDIKGTWRSKENVWHRRWDRWVSIIVSFYLTRSYSGACSVHTKHWIEAAKLQVCRQIDILNTSKTNKRRGSTHKHTVQCLFSNISNERQFTSFAMLIEAMPSSNLHELFIHFLLCVDVFWYILSHMSIYEYIHIRYKVLFAFNITQ